MGRITLLFLSMFIQTGVTEDRGWIDQSPRLLRKKWIDDVVALNAQTVIAVGAAGTIIRSTDGGASWNILSDFHIEQDLNSINFVNENVGYAVGDSGTILKTIDAGKNWVPLRSGISKKLYDVYFVNPDTGWAVGGFYIEDHINEGGIILKTTNGGKVWFTQTPSLPTSFMDGIYLLLRYLFDGPRTFSSVYFTDHNNGWIVGTYGTILKTTNGGENWIPQKSGTTHDLAAVHFINSKSGWAVGMFEQILNTTDGGITWITQIDGSSHSSTAHHFVFVYFANDSIGWSGGHYSPILKTTNSGKSWKTLSPEQTKHLYGIHFWNENIGWAVGNNGRVLKTTSGGEVGK